MQSQCHFTVVTVYLQLFKKALFLQNKHRLSAVTVALTVQLHCFCMLIAQNIVTFFSFLFKTYSVVTVILQLGAITVSFLV